MKKSDVKRYFLSELPVISVEKNHGKPRGVLSDIVQKRLCALDHEAMVMLSAFDPLELMVVGELMFRVKKAPPPANSKVETDCWLWTGAKRNQLGYGAFSFFTPVVLCSHRVTYQVFRGDILDGSILDHLCKVPACVNPWHLDPVTVKENVERGEATQFTCSYGHEFDFIDRQGKRRCSICKNRRLREWRARQKLKVMPHVFTPEEEAARTVRCEEMRLAQAERASKWLLSQTEEYRKQRSMAALNARWKKRG